VNGGDGYFKDTDINRNLSSSKHERKRAREMAMGGDEASTNAKEL
jgi:hypothetical protein